MFTYACLAVLNIIRILVLCSHVSVDLFYVIFLGLHVTADQLYVPVIAKAVA